MKLQEQELTPQQKLELLRKQRGITSTDDIDKPKDDTETPIDNDQKKQTPVVPDIELPPQKGIVTFSNFSVKEQNKLHKGLMRDIKKAAKNAQVNVEITFIKAGHKKETESGNVSRHYTYNAADISRIYGKVYGQDRGVFKAAGDKFVNELKKLGYELWEGNNQKSYIWQQDDHYNHIHVSRKPLSDKERTEATKRYKYKLDIHKKLQRLRYDMYNIFVANPQDYDLYYFKSNWGDDEKGAAKWVRELLGKINNGTLENDKTGYHLNKWENECWSKDKINIEQIRSVFLQIYKAILNKESPKIKATYYKFDHETNSWSKVNVIYNFTYFKG